MTPGSNRPHEVVIVGGGISGLAAAYYLEKQAAQASLDLSIQLLEADRRVGGVIRTERSGEYLVEAGPDSFLATKPAAVELCQQLQLAGALIGSNDERRKTYVWQGGRLRPLPDGLLFVVPARVWPMFRNDLLSPAGKLRLALGPFLPPLERPAEDRSVAAFIARRFGRQVLERLVEPLLAAVYGADVDTLSAAAALPQLVAIEQKYGNLWRGLPHARSEMLSRASRSSSGAIPQALFMTLRNGLGELVECLQKALRRTQLVTDAAVCGIRRQGRGYCVEHARGAAAASAVVVATPAPAAAQLLRPVDAELAGLLGGIRYHSSVIVALGYARRDLDHPLDGFGFIVPRTENKCLTACTWVSNKFPFRSGPEEILLRCFLGGSRNPDLLERTDEQILSATLRELGEAMQLRATPRLVRLYRWEKRMPQYDVGHLGRCEAIGACLKSHPGLALAGNGYRGVGIPDCIQSGAAAAAAVLAYLESTQ
ncbi:MAG TPA: protoporphyrinogen oxidase [Terriglobia bacterium]|nr:protoporphyrinogen oxidase [Terriglobia bacterium]